MAQPARASPDPLLETMPNTALVTGGRGFAGHALVKHLLYNTDWCLACPVRSFKSRDRLGELRTIEFNCRFVDNVENTKYDFIFHAAGNPSAVDCIANPVQSVEDNIVETLKVLELARMHKVQRFVFFSSCEVYGPDGVFSESDKCDSHNMYAATKLSCEEICKAYQRSYGVPISIVRINNTFGPRCQPERFPVVALRKLVLDEKIILHCDCTGTVCSKRWLPMEDVADMIFFITTVQPPGGIYNLTGRENLSNLDLLRKIRAAYSLEVRREVPELNFELKTDTLAGRVLIQDAPPDLIYSLGWRPKMSFDERLLEFVHFTMENKQWLA